MSTVAHELLYNFALDDFNEADIFYINISHFLSLPQSEHCTLSLVKRS